MSAHGRAEGRGLGELQQKLGYVFRNKELLREALTHKSYANEQGLANQFGNERLEFLGDAVLELVISHILMERFDDCAEGDLSKMRAAVVNKDSLFVLASKYGLGDHILLSRGEDENRGRSKRSILSNVYEAVIAAVYFDGGMEKVFQLIAEHFRPVLDEVAEKGFFKDYKSRLQEYCQREFNLVPHYRLITEEGPDHIKSFEFQVVIDGIRYEKGCGANKKTAEQNAARNTLSRLTQEEKGNRR